MSPVGSTPAFMVSWLKSDFTESDFQSEGSVPRKFTSWIDSTFSGGVIVSLRDRYELYSISGWSSLDVPRWVHTSFCSYYLELSPRDLRFRVLSWESPGTWEHMQGIGPTDREGMRKFSLNIRSPEVIWDRVNASTAIARVRSENRDLIKRVVIFISCVIDLDCGFLESG